MNGLLFFKYFHLDHTVIILAYALAYTKALLGA